MTGAPGDQRAQAGPVQGLPHHVRGEGPVQDLGDGQAHAVDRDRLAEGDALGGTPDGEPGRVAAVLDSGHLAEFCHDPGEHPRFLLEAQPAVRLRGWRGYVRTRFARPGLPDRLRAASHPDFHRRSRNFTGSAARWLRTGRGLSPPAGLSPTPEHALTPISQCATRGIPARNAVVPALRRQRAELVADAVFGDQALAVARAQLVPDPADVHVHGAAVPRDVLAVPRDGPVPDPLDQIRAGEHRGRVRAEEGQQLELPEGQLDLASVGPDAALPVLQAQPGSRGIAWCVTRPVSAASRRRTW